MSKIDEAKEILTELERKVPDIKGSAVIRTNGLIIVSALPAESSERMLAAMAAALLGTSKRTSESLFQGTFKSLHITVDKGDLFLLESGKVILVSMTNPEPNVGLVTLEMEDSSAKIKKIFE
ncbi:MAG: roadblock/LC7 domain-containing protein [Candidatus Helarchaeota archaeon]